MSDTPLISTPLTQLLLHVHKLYEIRDECIQELIDKQSTHKTKTGDFCRANFLEQTFRDFRDEVLGHDFSTGVWATNCGRTPFAHQWGPPFTAWNGVSTGFTSRLAQEIPEYPL